MDGGLFPALTDMNSAHVLHRWVAGVVGLVVVGTGWVAWRTQRSHPVLVRLAVAAAVLFPLQALVGGLQVLTGLEEWTQTIHLALGAVIWVIAAALAIAAYYEARSEVRRAGAPATVAPAAPPANDEPAEDPGAEAPTPIAGPVPATLHRWPLRPAAPTPSARTSP